MKHRLFLLIAISAFAVLGCSDKSEQDDKTRHASALCVPFVDQAIETFAMQNWDSNHDQCIDSSEAAAVTAIPALAFANNAQVQSLDDLSRFPNLTTIGNGAFSGCTNLATANIPSVTTIGNSAFAGCTGLTTVNAPNATAVGDAAFSGCTNLGTVNIPAQNPPTSQCTEGARKCSENGMQSLVCVRGNWAILENCPKGCKDNVCIVDTPMPACDEGAQKCSDSSALVIVCKDGHWIFKENCTNGCTDGVCHVASPVICPDKCKDNCDANGLCVDIVTPTCPSSCKNGCDDKGNCKPDEVTCPSSCMNGCNADGTCKPAEVTCPSSCKNGCNDLGNCKPDEVTCPSDCKNGCDADGNCKPDDVTCPSDCKNGCDADGNCKPDDVTCPSSCKNGCNADGTCKPNDVICPSDCKNGCDDDGNCKPDEVTCPSSCKNGCDDKGNCKSLFRCLNGIDTNGDCLCSNACLHGCDKTIGECLCPVNCVNGCDEQGSQCLCPERCLDGCDANGGCLDTNDINGNHMLDHYETAVNQGNACRTHTDCDSAVGKKDGFCDSFIGYRCSTRCTSDEECLGEYGDYNFVCRRDGRCTPDKSVTVWEVPDNFYMVIPFVTESFLYYYFSQPCGSGHWSDCDTCDKKFCTIDWGDGSITTAEVKSYGNPTSCDPVGHGHRYKQAGRYTIKTDCNYLYEYWYICVKNMFDRESYECGMDNCSFTNHYIKHLVEIKSFGPTSFVGDPYSCFIGALQDADSLSKLSVIDIPLGIPYLFAGSKTFNFPIEHWDASNEKYFTGLFFEATAFNQPLNRWDTSNIKMADWMFKGATAFNQPLNRWDTSNITIAESMFEGATSFNQDLSSWNMQNLGLGINMFRDSGMSQENYCKIQNSSTWPASKSDLGMDYTCH